MDRSSSSAVAGLRHRRRAVLYTDESLFPEVTTILIPEQDTLVNPLGIKGVGELGVVGLNAAVANAVYHAIAVRIRQLPIRIEKVLKIEMLKIAV
jgi:hypothetical protein